jgi:uncharacterized membrane protein
MEGKIVVFGFDRRYGAEGALGEIEKLVGQGLIDIEDAVVASRGVGTHVDIQQARPKSNKAAGKGAGAGLLAGILLGGPILGVAAGAAIGKIVGALKDYGLDDKFVKKISDGLGPESSALFLLVREAKVDEFKEKLKHFDAWVMSTNLSEEKEKALRKLVEK